MTKVHGSYIRETISDTVVGKLGIFTARVLEGIENFNLKRVFKAHVSSAGGGREGNYFYDNFNEAKEEALQILKEESSRFEIEMEELRKLYKPE